MAITIPKLSAAAANATASKINDSGTDNKITVAKKGDEVTFTATVEGATASTKLELRDATKKLADFTGTGKTRTAKWLAQDAVVHAAVVGESAKSSDYTVAVKPAVVAAVAAPAADPAKVAEPEPGEFDAVFAIWTGIVAVVVLVVVAIALWGVFDAFRVPHILTKVGSGEVITGTFSERFAAKAILAVLALGGVLLVAGAWTGSLETRGRLNKPRPKPEPVVVVDVEGKEGLAVVGDAAGKILEKLTVMRAVVAVLACGTGQAIAVTVVAAAIALASTATGAVVLATTTIDFEVTVFSFVAAAVLTLAAAAGQLFVVADTAYKLDLGGIERYVWWPAGFMLGCWPSMHTGQAKRISTLGRGFDEVLHRGFSMSLLAILVVLIRRMQRSARQFVCDRRRPDPKPSDIEKAADTIADAIHALLPQGARTDVHLAFLMFRSEAEETAGADSSPAAETRAGCCNCRTG